MPRISRALVAEREEFTTKNFQAGMTPDQANAALVDKYGMKMNPYRLKELFDAASNTTPVVLPSEDTSPKASFPNAPINPVTPSVIKASSKSILDLPAPTLSSSDGYMKIHDLVKAIEEDKYPYEK
jgi:hypothetical protein